MKKRVIVFGLIVSVFISVVLSGCGAITDTVGNFAEGLAEGNLEGGSTSADQVKERPQPIVTTSYENLMQEKKDNYGYILKTEYDTIQLDERSAAKLPELDKALRKFSEDIIPAQKKVIEEAKKNGIGQSLIPNQHYTDNQNIIVIRCDEDILSFESYIYTNYGSSRSRSEIGHSFDVKTGKTIDLLDVVKSGPELVSVIKERLKKEYPYVEFFDDLDSILERYTTGPDYKLNWLLTQDGLRIIFNPNDIAQSTSGFQAIDLRFADYPNLFTGMYKAYTGGYITSIPLTTRLDLNHDGKLELLSIEGIKNLGDPDIVEDIKIYYNGIEKKLREVSDNKSPIFNFKVKLVHTRDNSNYVYILAEQQNSYNDIYIFELGDHSVQFKGSVGGFESKYAMVDPEGFYISDVGYTINTIFITRFFTIGANGIPFTNDEFFEAYAYQDKLFVIAKDFIASGVDKETNELKDEVPLKKGDKLRYFRTNGKDTDIFTKEDGTLVGLKFSDHYYVHTMNGDIPAHELFEELFSAG